MIFSILVSIVLGSQFTCSLDSLRLLLLGLHVGSNEELSKKEEEGEDVNNVDGSHAKRNTVRLRHEEPTSLSHHRDELNHLHHCQTRLPPNWQGFASFGYLCVHTDEVVRVHDSVDEAVQHNGEEDVTIVVAV